MSYTIDAAKVYANITLQLDRRNNISVFAKQYDNNMRIVAATLTKAGQPYTVPEGYSAYVREGKRDGTGVHNPALAVDGSTVYITLTQQMLAVEGRQTAEIEIVQNEGGDVLSSASFWLDVEADPLSEDTIESSDEYLTLQQLIALAHQYSDNATQKASEAADSAAEAAQSESNSAQSEATASAAATYIQQNIEAINAAPDAANRAEDAAERAEEAAAAAQAGTLIDDTTGEIYKLGIDNGALYYQQVTENEGGGS